jgi:hypothetical protein
MTDDLLRRALQRQAERAPDPDRVRAELPRQATLRTRRRYGALAGGLVAAAALAAVAVPVLALDDAGPGEQFGAPPAASEPASASPVPSMPATVGLRYRPGWLPAGLTERSRTVPVGPTPYDGPVRVYKKAGTDSGFDMGGTRLEFGVVAADKGVDPFGDHGQKVDINGRQGRLSPGGKSSVHWLIDPQTVIFIHNVEGGVSDADLLRIARSVEPDTGQVPVPVKLGRLPAGMTPFSAQFSGDSPDRWRLEVSALGQMPATGIPTARAGEKKGDGTQAGDRGIYVRLGPTTDAPAGGGPTTIGGRPGRIVATPVEGPVPGEHTYIVVQLASNLTLTVFGLVPDVPRAELVAVAEGVEVGAVPDLSWLGVATR